MDLDRFHLALLIGTVVVLLAVTAVRLSLRVGLPSLLIYLAIGLALGEDGLGIRFDNAGLAQILGYAALIVILAEGGLTTRWSQVRPGVAPAAVLSTLGVLVSVGITGAVARLVLDTGWREGLLLGAVVSSTDAAAVFSTLRRVPLRRRLIGILEAESGFNDAPVVLLVTLLAETGGHGSPLELVALGVYELAAGALIGVLAGALGALFLRRSALPSSGLYPLTALAFTVLGYAGAVAVHASGFLAVYLAALWLGNADLPHRQATVGFVEGVAWLAQIGLFVMLGLLAAPSRLPAAVLPALAVGAALLLLARPVSVVVSTLPFRLPWRQQAFLCWAGLRGAVPIVLATIPVTTHEPGGRRLFDLVFVLVVVFTLVQSPVLAPLARRLRVTAEVQPRDIYVEAAPLEDLHADLLQLTVPPASRLAGVHIGELRLPVGAGLTLVVRDGGSFVPDRDTVLRAGDELLIVTTTAARSAAEKRLRAVSRRGRLAGWDAGDGPGS